MTSLAVFCIFENPISIVDRVEGSTLYVNETGSGGAHTSIQDAIDAANPGDTVYVYAGVYFENLVVNKTINLTGEDRDTTIIDGGGSGDVVTVDADWVNITGFTATHGSNGITLDYSDNCRIMKNNASSNNIRGIDVSGSDHNDIIDNIVLENNYGIDIGSSDHNRINDNLAAWNFKDGIILSYSSGNQLIGNTMTENGIHISGEYLEHWNTHDINTSNSVNGKSVFYLKNQTGGSTPAGAGQVILANCTQVKVEDQELTNASVGIQLGFSSGNMIINNTLFDNWDGIYLRTSHENVISLNNASDNRRGIYIYDSNENNITENIFHHNSDGIEIESSTRNEIINNSLIQNTLCGVILHESNWHVITDNIIMNNHNGVSLWNSNWNNITRNLISSNGDGIHLSSSSDNQVYHNALINNEMQAFDDSNIGNQWDASYPLGGNYWSDYDGVDNFKGPNQNVSGNDSIGDTPYVIDSDSKDNYPLMESPVPFENDTIVDKNGNLTRPDIDYIISMQDIETMEGYFSTPANIDLLTQAIIKIIADTNDDGYVSSDEADELLDSLTEEQKTDLSLRTEDLEILLLSGLGIDFNEPSQIEVMDMELDGLEGPVDSPTTLVIIIQFHAEFNVGESSTHTISVGINGSYPGNIFFKLTIPPGWEIDDSHGLIETNIYDRNVSGKPTGQVDILIKEKVDEEDGSDTQPEYIWIFMVIAILIVVILLIILLPLMRKKNGTEPVQPQPPIYYSTSMPSQPQDMDRRLPPPPYPPPYPPPQ